jgi:HAD superfamily hydrolase (TIGR01450 family)
MTLADRFDAFLFDLDGVVWRGEELIPGAGRTITELREQDKRVVFMTNNASRSPRQYAVKLMRMRIPTDPADVVTSGHVVISHLRKIGLRRGDRIHLCAAPALGQLLRSEGFTPTNQTRGVKAVVVAWNPKVGFDDIRFAADVARSDVPFIAANSDATYPSEHGLLPGSGAILAAIEAASGKRATVVGKPRPEIVRLALERAGSDPARTLVCGDRPETDVAAARAAGLPVALVLTGVTLETDLAALTERPDWILHDVGELLSADVPEPAAVSPGPVVERGLGGTAETAEHEHEQKSGDEPADVGQVRDSSLPDLP